MTFQIAQLNIGILKKPIDDPANIEFVENLDRINSLGEKTPGFVWRLKDDDGIGATGIQAYKDSRIIVNFTIWESIESLYQFTYRDAHSKIFKRRSEWFVSSDQPSLVIWWIPKGTIPSLEEAKSRLDHLRIHGASPLAFTFRQRFDPVIDPLE